MIRSVVLCHVVQQQKMPPSRVASTFVMRDESHSSAAQVGTPPSVN